MLKKKYGLRRKHLPSRLSVPGLAGTTVGIRQPADTISSTPSDSLADNTRSRSRISNPTHGDLGRDITSHSESPSKPIGGIIPPSTRNRKRRGHRRGFFRLISWNNKRTKKDSNSNKKNSRRRPAHGTTQLMLIGKRDSPQFRIIDSHRIVDHPASAGFCYWRASGQQFRTGERRGPYLRRGKRTTGFKR